MFATLNPIVSIIFYVYLALLVIALAYYSIRMWIDLHDDQHHNPRSSELKPRKAPDYLLWAAVGMAVFASIGTLALAIIGI